MSFQRDEQYAVDLGPAFGEYLTTFVSQPAGQVRADIFQESRRIVAHVSFPTGVAPSNVTEPYVGALWQYARERGKADQFQLVMS